MRGIFYEDHLGKFFESTMHEVLDAEYALNRKFIKEGQVCLNDFFELLGQPVTLEGELVRWVRTQQNLVYISYEKFELDDGLECCQIKLFAKNANDVMERK